LVRSDGTLSYPGRIGLIALAAVGLVLAVVDPFTLLSFLSYLAIGILLAIRRPNTVVSWLLIAIALSFTGTSTQPGVDVQGLIDGTASLYDKIVTWAAVWSGQLLFTLYAALAAVFPSGALPAGRWGRALRIVLSLSALVVLLSALGPTADVNQGDESMQVPNPFGVIPAGPIAELGKVVGLGVAIAAIAIAVASLLARYRTATGTARLQLRWLLAAITFVLFGILFGILATVFTGDQFGGIIWLPAVVAYPTVPIAVAVAIFRYRLYQIDRIVNRALVYGAVTAILAGVFAAATALSQRVFIALTGESSDASVVLTTLAVATAYTPVRTRVESFVDRYFKYEQRRYGAYRDELNRLLGLVDPVHAARRLATEAAAETRAVGVAVTDADGRVLASAGQWPTDSATTVPIRARSAPVGSIILGPRRDGEPHDAAALETLAEVAIMAAAAIGERRVAAADAVAGRLVPNEDTRLNS
jgi:hypothetical protein